MGSFGEPRLAIHEAKRHQRHHPHRSRTVRHITWVTPCFTSTLYPPLSVAAYLLVCSRLPCLYPIVVVALFFPSLSLLTGLGGVCLPSVKLWFSEHDSVPQHPLIITPAIFPSIPFDT